MCVVDDVCDVCCEQCESSVGVWLIISVWVGVCVFVNVDVSDNVFSVPLFECLCVGVCVVVRAPVCGVVCL